MKKPIVYYIESRDNFIFTGHRAIIDPVDHPRFPNPGRIRTSVVIKYDIETGVFETKNTIYKPYKVDIKLKIL